MNEDPMLHYDFEESHAYWIVITSHAFERALNDELTPHGITYRQWQVLGWLALEGELSQVALAERMRIEPPTLVGILDRMEKAGWIRRRGCTDDRRRKLVSPTPSAKPIWAKVVECARRVRSESAAGLSAEELSQLKASLEKIRANLAARNQGKVPAESAPFVESQMS
jgi:MarR family transcriptional regulator for hemolysin